MSPAPRSDRDEVDEIVARWRSERPDLDVAPLHVLSRVTRLARHLDLVRRAAFTAHGLETWEFDVLSALRRAGPPYQLSPGALLRATLVASGTMTNRIDRLAAAGLVSRSRDPQDKRGVLVRLTAQGRRTVDAAMSDLLTRERAILTALDAGQQNELAGLLRVLLTPFDAAGYEAAGYEPAGPEPAGSVAMGHAAEGSHAGGGKAGGGKAGGGKAGPA